MSNVEIDKIDAVGLVQAARSLSDRATLCFDGQDHVEQRAAALLISTAWMLLHGGFRLEQRSIDQALRTCERNHVCPCKISIAGGPPLVEMADVVPAWALELEAIDGR